MRRVSFAIPVVTCLILAAGCQDSTSVGQPSSFDRPEDVAFVCFDAGSAQLVPLSECEARIDDEERSLDPEQDALRLLALVTQTGRGEVAAVDLTEGLVLDADRRVPGFTFVRVSEVPVGIVVHPARPELTYVASFAARRLEAVATARFDPRTREESSRVEVPPALALPGAPNGLALAPGGDALYMPLPAQSAVYRVPLDADGAFVEEDAEMIPLPGPMEEPDPVDLTTPSEVPATAQAGNYERACLPQDADEDGRDGPEGLADLYDIPDPDAEPPREPVAAGEAPRPVALRFDPDPGVSGTVDGDAPVRLFVADEARPVVHVLHLEEGMDGLEHRHEGINVQVPTQGLALTPPVPSVGLNETGDCELARYLYAIDATDGSVLAVDVSDESAGSYGAVLPVGTGAGANDRIDFGAGRARTIEVLTPEYEDAAADPCGAGRMCEAGVDELNRPSPGQLRGVFLAAGMTDGTLRFADIVDLDAPCRPSEGCRDADADTGLFVQRHRPRLDTGRRVVVELGGPPSFAFDGIPNPVLPTGDVEAGEAPGLASLGNECPGGKLKVFGREPMDDAIVCVTADPWSSRAETWQAAWEGVIPGTQGGRGRFTGDREFLASGADFCARGVLGSDFNVDDLGDNDPELGVDGDGYGGDALVVTSPLPDAKALEDEFCADTFVVEEGEEPPDIAFAIRRAEQMEDGTGRLVLGEALGDFGLDAVRRCYDELVGYEVRLRDAYRVAGSRSGFPHRVHAGDGGRCEVDVSQSDRLNGRAFPTLPYENPFVAFQIRAFDERDEDEDGMPDMLGVPRGSTATLEFDLVRAPAPLFADLCSPGSASRCLTALPTTMRFNDVDQRLYIVDTAERGLMTIQTRPLQILQAFE